MLARRIIEGLSETVPAERVILTTLSGGLPDSRPLLASPKQAFFVNFFAIRRLMRSADIIHAFDVFPFGIIAYIASFGLCKKIVLTAMGSGSLVPLYSFWHRWLSALAFRRADAVVTISRFMRDEIFKKVPDISIFVIAPGIDRSILEERDEATAKVRAYQPYLLSVGALRWRKGYALTIRAFAKIKKEFPDMQYVIVGKRYADKEYEKLVRIIREEGLEGSVYILDSIDTDEAKRELYRGAELFGLLSQNVHHDVEGFGIVFLEAAAAGLPVVGSKGCGVEDAMQEGVNGILVDSSDADAFAEAVIRIKKTPGLLDAMSKASREYAKRFLWEDKIRAYGEAYRRLM